MQIDAGTQAVTRRQYKPFGEVRTAAADWQGTKGYVGGQQDDATGLTNLGAREYDPSVGRFLNPDPLISAGDPESWNAYAYANNSPVTLSDPSGLCPADLCGIGTPYGDGSGRIITDGPVDPGGPNRTTCHKGRCSDGLAVGDDNGGRGHIGNTTQNVQAEAAKAAQEVKTASAVAAAAKKQREGLTQKVISLVADVIGLTDAVNCFTKGDVMGCVNTALNAVPWGKIAKAIKAGWKAFKIWRALKKADKLVKEAEDLVRAAEASAKAASSQVKAMESAAAACTKHSFKGDTHVLLADGTTKPIADLRPGDEVTSTDPQTEVTAAEKVERHIVTKDDKEFTDLLLTPEPAASHAVGPVAAPATGAGTPRPVKLTTTWHHPFWDATHHRWTDARNLKPGTELQRPGGATAVVSAVRNYRASGVTYDLTVGVVHTYYVVAGATPVLVHNCLTGAGEDDLAAVATKTFSRQLSEAGRALQKHSSNLAKRGQAHTDLYNFGKVTDRERSEIAEEIIHEVLTSPNATRAINPHLKDPLKYGGSTLDIKIDGGWGARWRMKNGSLAFAGFL
ncbi:polymorphic toxin-type HINT domain-containing protein [Streptomyces sp. NBC_00464]|uniref:RHS repeat-associated core domain-containing protein n=1 Tax=Streptomyces sp. NBC_00464 TaxID=2975751 RepID=UPI002E18DD1A